jgi:hypothetical protein
MRREPTRTAAACVRQRILRQNIQECITSFTKHWPHTANRRDRTGVRGFRKALNEIETGFRGAKYVSKVDLRCGSTELNAPGSPGGDLEKSAAGKSLNNPNQVVA